MEQNELKRRKRRSFTQVDNEIANNEEISWQAKGLMLYLLSKPDGWVFYESDLTKRATNGKDSVRATLKELLDYGYLKRGERFRNEKGYLGGYKYTVEDYLYESYDGKSYIGKSKVGKSKVGNSYVGKSATSNTESFSNTNPSSNTEKDNKTKKEQSSLSSEIFKLIEQNNIAALTEYVAEEINFLINDTSEELVLKAVQIAVENNARNLRYIKSIIRNWKNEGYRTIDQMENGEKRNGKHQNTYEAPKQYDDGVNF